MLRLSNVWNGKEIIFVVILYLIWLAKGSRSALLLCGCCRESLQRKEFHFWVTMSTVYSFQNFYTSNTANPYSHSIPVLWVFFFIWNYSAETILIWSTKARSSRQHPRPRMKTNIFFCFEKKNYKGSIQIVRHYYHSDECISIFRKRNLSSYSSPFSATKSTKDSTDVGINSWSEKTIQKVSPKWKGAQILWK